MKRLLLLFFMLCGINIFSQATISVNVDSRIKTNNYYEFPDLTVTGNPTDRGFLVRIMFTRAVTNLDKIDLPALPSGWTSIPLPVGTTNPNHLKLLSISGTGATPAELQAFLRGIRINVDPDKNGHGVIILISESAEDAGRFVYYCSDTDNWYELIKQNGISWYESYNGSADKTLMGQRGYLVTVTSKEENTFISSMISSYTWTAGTRLDIRSIYDPATGKLTSDPSPLGPNNPPVIDRKSVV